MKRWIAGLLARRMLALGTAALGIALAVALTATLGLFVLDSAAGMTARAVSKVGPDWQVQQQGADTANAMAALDATIPAHRQAVVDFADISGLTANVGGTVQTTGAGKAVGLDLPAYAAMFPGQIRLMTGSLQGAVIAQQTAANLHAAVGDKVAIQRIGATPVEVTVAGVVELPQADQFFQQVGGMTRTGPSAPPDNVVLLPPDSFAASFGAQLDSAPQIAWRQLHLAIDHTLLPPDPVAALTQSQGLARHFEAQVAGGAVLADNLSARIDGVRQDSLFARVLFLFLGLPGVAVALLLTARITGTGHDRRRAELAILQVRGMRSAALALRMAAEGILVAGMGTAVGLALASTLAKAMGLGFGHLWAWGLAIAVGLGATAVLYGLPLRSDLARPARENLLPAPSVGALGQAWRRMGLDLVFLAIAAAVYFETTAQGYHLVTAPEGVPVAAVDYKSYLAPGMLWLGAGLLILRLADWGLERGRGVVAGLLRPVAGRYAPLVAAGIARDRRRIATGILLVALTFSFAVSTSVFNTTYDGQALVDAQLTNGADVTVTGTPDNPAQPVLDKVAATRGIATAQGMMHRYAYVGTDLQDIYGIDPAKIGQVTTLSDAYFQGMTAKAAMAELAAVPDGVFVADETVKDFQLVPGDRINLRLRMAGKADYAVVPFTFAGVVREFPTAPTDSFLVANATYLAKMTGLPLAETVLARANGDPAVAGAAVRAALSGRPDLKVTDLTETARRIGSSLVAVDLRGLTALETGFAGPLMAGALGLVLALGHIERRRSLAVLRALGGGAACIGAFLWSEALVVLGFGLAAGLGLGMVLAGALVKMITQVFDPPPEVLAVPWLLLAGLGLAGALAMVLAVLWALRSPRETLAFALRGGTDG
jgi:putative ABC transport system permease protein